MKNKVAIAALIILIGILGLQIIYTPVSRAQELGADATTTPMPELDTDLLPMFTHLLMTDLPNCTLPCWWGLKPGVSNVQDIVGFISSHGLNPIWQKQLKGYPGGPLDWTLERYLQEGFGVGLTFVPDQPDFSSLSLGFVMNGATLQTTNVDIVYPYQWLDSRSVNRILMPTVLKSLTEMPEVFINTFRVREFGDLWIYLVYKGRGTIINYHISVENLYWLNLGVCSDFITEITFRLNVPSEADFLREVSSIETFDTPESLWGVSTAEFIQQIRNDPYHCFHAPYHTPTPTPNS